MSVREIARRFHHSRQKVREVLRGEAEPPPYRQRERQTAPKLGGFHDLILQILADDESDPPTQRHTAMRIFERLRKDDGHEGGCDVVKGHRTDNRETFIPLDHDAGQRLEADFGHVSVDFPIDRTAGTGGSPSRRRP